MVFLNSLRGKLYYYGEGLGGGGGGGGEAWPPPPPPPRPWINPWECLIGLCLKLVFTASI